VTGLAAVGAAVAALNTWPVEITVAISNRVVPGGNGLGSNGDRAGAAGGPAESDDRDGDCWELGVVWLGASNDATSL
jgi:hypothetical protein